MTPPPPAGANSVRVLALTSQWPSESSPTAGIFVARQVEALRRLGVHVEVLAFRGLKHPLRFFRAWRRVRRHVRAGEFDIVHAYWGQNGLLALPKSRRIPLVVSMLGTDLFGATNETGRYSATRSVLPAISRLVARRADAIVVPTSRLRALLPDPGVATLVPFGIDSSLFRPISREHARMRLGLRTEGRVVLFAGDPSRPVKRFQLAREAVSQLADESVKLLTLGSVEPEDVPLYMNASDVLLITSLHEGGPIVAREALACNVPVVSTDVGDVREWTRRLNGCFVSDDGSPESLAEGLRMAMAARSSFSGGREALSSGFGDEPARALADLYVSVLRMAKAEH